MALINIKIEGVPYQVEEGLTILEAAKTEFSKFEVALNSVKNRMRQADEEMEKLVGTRFRAVQRKLRTVSTLEEEEKSKEILGIEESDDPFSF